MGTRRPTDCRDCAYAGDGSFGDDFIYCFRRHRHMSERDRCDSGLPLKAASRRLKKRSGRWPKN